MRTALVIVVPEAEPVVGPLRTRYAKADETGIPAHVTLLFPFGDRDDGLAELFAAFAPLDFALTDVRRWPGVVWLAPKPVEPFVALIHALVARHPEHPPYEGAHEAIVPHLTVGVNEVPADVDIGLQRVLPIAARATHVVQLEEYEPDRWRERRRFPLGRLS